MPQHNREILGYFLGISRSDTPRPGVNRRILITGAKKPAVRKEAACGSARDRRTRGAMAHRLLTTRSMSKHNRGVASAIVAGLLLVVAAAKAGAQSSQAPSGQHTPAGKTEKPLVLTGCVTADRAAPDRFTLVDAKAGVKYRLYGVKIYAYEGRRVRIVGGLYPSANIAAQAGAIDPTKAAIAATAPDGILGTPKFLDFRVTQVRSIKGSCPPTP